MTSFFRPASSKKPNRPRPAEVARAQPAVGGDRRAGGVVVAVVAAHHARALHRQLADLALRHLLARVVDAPRNWSPAHRPQPADRQRHRGEHADRRPAAELDHAVAVDERRLADRAAGDRQPGTWRPCVWNVSATSAGSASAPDDHTRTDDRSRSLGAGLQHHPVHRRDADEHHRLLPLDGIERVGRGGTSGAGTPARRWTPAARGG